MMEMGKQRHLRFCVGQPLEEKLMHIILPRIPFTRAAGEEEAVVPGAKIDHDDVTLSQRAKLLHDVIPERQIEPPKAPQLNLRAPIQL